MKLTEIIPLDKLAQHVKKPLDVSKATPKNWRELAKVDEDELFNLALFGWHRLVLSGHVVDPTSIGPLIDTHDYAALVTRVEDVVGQPLFKEAGLMEARVLHRKKSFAVAASTAVVLYSGELYLSDIGILNPARRIPKKDKKSPSHSHEGFALLGETMRNVFAAARERKCSLVTLTAAWRPLVPIFERHGFSVEDSIAAKNGMRLGFGIPMEARPSAIP